jgi:hypothetical protein
MYKCLKDGWITLQEFKTKYELTTWKTTSLPIKLDKEFQCKIGAVIFIFESEAIKIK